ncbi:hypothetical protein [Nodularia sp. NIES-3585]|uniref:hypothetical protein n=1 Tax=Nodularia sp. NIES-3585 TaxID=1973477 RepID=UPI000B5C57A9|nr:hypothetical protein [Nodularia sp. NIES-3585]GAX34524.1 phage tail collar domain-conataing protein [Nodularia sp. NIES-3585]
MTATKKQPFNFLFYYESDTGERTKNALLVGGDPSTASPLHLQIGIQEAKQILILPLPGITTASPSNYHLKLQFDTAKLLQPEQITVDSDDWDLHLEKDTIFYLLWKKEEVTLDENNSIKLMLNGVMATLESTQQNATTTNVTLSWEFKRDGITIIDVTPTAPGETDPYEKSFTETLNIIQQQGLAIPLYVGFFSSNRVLNTNNQESELRLRITNMSNSPITFRHDLSQLVVALEVGDANTFPWALGTKDLLNGVVVSIDGDKWGFKKIEEKGRMLEWTFTPKSDPGVELKSQDTMIIKLSQIVTDYPTGMTNLYLRSHYVPGYRDSEFICQIEKTPLVYPDKNVGIGTTTPTAKLQINGTGTTFLSGNGATNQVTIQDGNLGIGTTPTAKLQIDGTGTTFLSGNGTANQVVIQDGNLGIGTTDPKGKLDMQGSIKINGSPAMKSEEYLYLEPDILFSLEQSPEEWGAFIAGSRIIFTKQVNASDQDKNWKIITSEYNNILKGIRVKVLFIRKEFFE